MDTATGFRNVLGAMSEPEIAGRLLLAMPQLPDPNFARSVVLMIDHSDQGSFGLIVNRPTDVRVADVMTSLGVRWSGSPEEPVWTGGPVMPQSGWLLHSQEDPGGGGETVAVGPGIVLSTSPQQLQALAAAPPGQLRFLMGYSGWGSGQLEEELIQSSWLLAEATPPLIFETPAEAMWEASIRSLGVEPATLVPGAGVH